MAFSSLLLQAQPSGSLQGLSNTISDLSQTIGVDLFEEDIDNVVFQTNEFLCNPDFIGTQGPFWWILQMSMALGALFSIIVGASMAYKMMVKGEAVDVFKILKVMGIALIMIFWYPPSMTGMGSGNGSILDALAYIPNCIGSYTHDLYEAEAVQVSEKYNELMPLLQKRDTMYQKAAEVEAAESFVNQAASMDIISETAGGNSSVEGSKAATRAKKSSVFAGLIIGFDKIVMFLALVLYRVGWWATIFCQQILLGMLTIFGPIQWAFSVLPKWEGAWAKWLIRYLTVHFYGAMLYFVGFYVLLLFDIVISVQVENLTAITSSTGTINGYIQNAFMTCGYLLAASVVALRCLNLVPDLAAWMIPEGDTAFSTRNFGEGVASSVKSSAMSVMPRIH
ncbi:hypothetical protein [Segatella buccae]|uniref:hypothetical protein n=1 Tax=Segatella buccae TaxID=28126 RepID=UPI00242A97CC|nr:hypothetical protein [Segatella buccae]